MADLAKTPPPVEEPLPPQPASPSPFRQLWPAYLCVMTDYMGLALSESD